MGVLDAGIPKVPIFRWTDLSADPDKMRTCIESLTKQTFAIIDISTADENNENNDQSVNKSNNNNNSDTTENPSTTTENPSTSMFSTLRDLAILFSDPSRTKALPKQRKGFRTGYCEKKMQDSSIAQFLDWRKTAVGIRPRVKDVKVGAESDSKTNASSPDKSKPKETTGNSKPESSKPVPPPSVGQALWEILEQMSLRLLLGIATYFNVPPFVILHILDSVVVREGLEIEKTRDSELSETSEVPTKLSSEATMLLEKRDSPALSSSVLRVSRYYRHFVRDGNAGGDQGLFCGGWKWDGMLCGMEMGRATPANLKASSGPVSKGDFVTSTEEETEASAKAKPQPAGSEDKAGENPTKKKIQFAAHTDSTLVTLTCAAAPGLELFLKKSDGNNGTTPDSKHTHQWIPIGQLVENANSAHTSAANSDTSKSNTTSGSSPSIASGSLICVMIGDFLELLTNERLTATPHRISVPRPPILAPGSEEEIDMFVIVKMICFVNDENTEMKYKEVRCRSCDKCMV